MKNDLPTSEPVNPPPLATKEEWGAAWDMFNEGVRRLSRLAVNDGVTIKLNALSLGWVPRRNKAKKS